jgi:hypothetical protein
VKGKCHRVNRRFRWSAWKVLEGGRKGTGLMEDSKGLTIWNPERRISGFSGWKERPKESNKAVLRLEMFCKVPKFWYFEGQLEEMAHLLNSAHPHCSESFLSLQ